MVSHNGCSSDLDETLSADFDFSENPSQSEGVLIIGSTVFRVKPGKIVTIGRDPSADMYIPNPLVSRRHATFEIISDCHFITDANSKLGTFRKGVRVMPGRTYELANDTELKFGPECTGIYKIEKLSDSFAKPNTSLVPTPQRERVPELKGEIKSSMDSMGESLFLDPTQTDVNNSIASLSKTKNDTLNESDIKMAMICGKVEEKIEEEKFPHDEDHSNDDTLDTVSNPSDSELAMAVLQAEGELGSKDQPNEPLFSVPPVGADSSEAPTTVHWKGADETEKDVFTFDEEERKVVGASILECDTPLQDTSAAKSRSKRRKAVIDESSNESNKQDGPTVKKKPGRKLKVTPNSTEAAPQTELVSPPTKEAAAALVQLKTKSARKSRAPSTTSNETPLDEEASHAKKARHETEEESKGKTPSRARKTISRRSTIAAREAKILITGDKDDKTSTMINKLGAIIADSISDCTHLVVGGSAKRTVKFVACVGHGIPIAGVEWLRSSLANKHLLEPDDFPPEGIDLLEKGQEFKLGETLEKTRKKRLLDGFSLYAVPKTSKLKDDEIKAMVKAAGGRYLTRAPKTFSENTIILVGDGAVPAGSDQQAPPQLSKPPNVSTFAALGLPMVSSEFLLKGILRYDSEPSHFPVAIDVSMDQQNENELDVEAAVKKPVKSRRTTMTKTNSGDGAIKLEKKKASRNTMKVKKVQEDEDEND